MKNTKGFWVSCAVQCLAAYSHTAGRPADVQALKDNEAR